MEDESHIKEIIIICSKYKFIRTVELEKIKNNFIKGLYSNKDYYDNFDKTYYENKIKELKKLNFELYNEIIKIKNILVKYKLLHEILLRIPTNNNPNYKLNDFTWVITTVFFGGMIDVCINKLIKCSNKKIQSILIPKKFNKNKIKEYRGIRVQTICNDITSNFTRTYGLPRVPDMHEEHSKLIYDSELFFPCVIIDFDLLVKKGIDADMMDYAGPNDSSWLVRCRDIKDFLEWEDKQGKRIKINNKNYNHVRKVGTMYNKKDSLNLFIEHLKQNNFLDDDELNICINHYKTHLNE